jgi:Na+/melibiose symporter-like transporter
MRIMFATVPAALGLLLTLVFPLSKARSLEIRRELNARKSIA